MNIDTGHLKKLSEEDEKKFKELLGEMQELGYEQVPKELERAAEKKLAGKDEKDEAYVSLTSGGQLSKWAAKKRKERSKMAKASRRRNRK